MGRALAVVVGVGGLGGCPRVASTPGAADAGVLAGGAGASASRVADAPGWFRALDPPEGWSWDGAGQRWIHLGPVALSARWLQTDPSTTPGCASVFDRPTARASGEVTRGTCHPLDGRAPTPLWWRWHEGPEGWLVVSVDPRGRVASWPVIHELVTAVGARCPEASGEIVEEVAPGP